MVQSFCSVEKLKRPEMISIMKYEYIAISSACLKKPEVVIIIVFIIFPLFKIIYISAF